jgi:hypothetical protein
VAALAMLAGCGSSDPAPAIRQTLKQYFDDLGSGNTSDACSLLAPAIKQQLGGGRCPERLNSLISLIGEAALKKDLAALHAERAKITVAGNRASANLGFGTSIPFVNQRGHWLIQSGRFGLQGR